MNARKVSAAMDEYIRREVTRPDLVGINNKAEIEKLPRGFYDQLVYFSSPSREPTSAPARGEYTWSIPALNYDLPVENCTAIRIGSFTLPIDYSNADIHGQFVKNKIYVEIAQLPIGTGYRTTNGRRFHFECDVEYVGVEYVVATPVHDTIYLRSPLPYMDTFTLRFLQNTPRGVFNVFSVVLRDEAFPVTVVPGSNPAQFNTASAAVAAASIGEPGTVFAAPSLEAYFDGFATDDPAFNAAIAGTNNRIALLGPGAGNTMFEVAGVSAAAVTTGLRGTLFLPKNKVDVCVRFTCILPKTENYISATHI